MQGARRSLQLPERPMWPAVCWVPIGVSVCTLTNVSPGHTETHLCTCPTMAMMPSAMGVRLGWQEPPLPSYLDLDKFANPSTPQSPCLRNEGGPSAPSSVVFSLQAGEVGDTAAGEATWAQGAASRIALTVLS